MTDEDRQARIDAANAIRSFDPNDGKDPTVAKIQRARAGYLKTGKVDPCLSGYHPSRPPVVPG